MPKTWSADKFESLRYGVLLVLTATCFLVGGASRLDIPGLMLLQPLAVVCAATFFLIPGPFRWDAVRIPLVLLGALAGVMAVQLIPLPPSLWASLPGHGTLAETARVAGVEQSWRPISVAPDLTLASLAGLVVPLAALVGFASVPVERSYRLLPVLIIGSGLSAFLGLAQVAGGPHSPFYLYSVTNNQSPVGFFSNRNHEAVLLAMTWPMLALWATLPSSNPKTEGVRRWIAVAYAIFLVPMLVVTGSRAGIILGVVGLGFAVWQWRRRPNARTGPASRWERLALPAALLVTVAVIGAAIGTARDEAVRRTIGLSVAEDARLEFTPTLVQIARDFFAVGSGFGTFDPVFRYYEPLELLKPTYLNHAHNDLIELIITGGLPALAILICFLVWVSAKWLTFARGGAYSRSLGFGRLSAAMIVIFLLSSLVDYPLRTPLAAILFAFACGWLANYSGVPARSRSGAASPKELYV